MGVQVFGLAGFLLIRFFIARFFIPFFKLLHFLANFALKPTRAGLVPVGLLRQGIRQVGFASGVSVGLVVGVAVGAAVAKLLHELGGGVAQVDGDFAAFVLFDKGAYLFVGAVACIAFGGYGQIDDGLRECQLTFGAA